MSEEEKEEVQVGPTEEELAEKELAKKELEEQKRIEKERIYQEKKIIFDKEVAEYEIQNGHKEKRRQAYPDIRDQLDAIMKWVAGENEITVTSELKSIAMKCMSVKAQFPKHPDYVEKE